VAWISWLQGIALVALNNLVLLFWKPWAGAYAGEKGKNLARTEDLDVILTEVRAVTKSQREIEAKISGDLWDRQMRWQQKRDVYGRLLETIGEFQMILGAEAGKVHAGHLEQDWEWGEDEKRVATELRRQDSVAQLFVSEAAALALTDLLTAIPPGDDPAVRLSIAVASVEAARQKLVDAAKKDLGLPD
jgi:fructosamine-3-kinase